MDQICADDQRAAGKPQTGASPALETGNKLFAGSRIHRCARTTTAKPHLWNRNWPPHAKFHNGQTMLMVVFGGLLSLAILFGGRPLTLSSFLLATAAAYLIRLSQAGEDGWKIAESVQGVEWTEGNWQFHSNIANFLGTPDLS
jgi:hypothetical protein